MRIVDSARAVEVADQAVLGKAARILIDSDYAQISLVEAEERFEELKRDRERTVVERTWRRESGVVRRGARSSRTLRARRRARVEETTAAA